MPGDLLALSVNEGGRLRPQISYQLLLLATVQRAAVPGPRREQYAHAR